MVKREILGTGRYAVAESQQFVDRSGKIVRVTRGSLLSPTPVGRAYAFFGRPNSRSSIMNMVPSIRDAAGTPDRIEAYLSDTRTPIGVAGELAEVFREARGAKMNHCLRMDLPDGTNEQAADELSTFMNQAYQSPLYSRGEDFNG